MGGVTLEYSPTLYLAAEFPTAPYTSMPPRGEDWTVSPSLHIDLRIARSTRANLFLVGADPLVSNALRVVVPDLNHGTVIRRRGGRLLLPPASSRLGTVVVHDVDTLTPDDQYGLLDWMDAVQYRTQVVSTTSAPMLMRVEAGAFNDTLYYRLNKIYVDLSE